MAGDRCDRYVCRVSTGADADETQGRSQSSRVEQVPFSIEEGFHESMEVWRVQIQGIAGDIPRRDPDSPTQRDRQMCVVAAHSRSLQQHVSGCRRRYGAARCVVKLLENPIADGLNSAETRLEGMLSTLPRH